MKILAISPSRPQSTNYINHNRNNNNVSFGYGSEISDDDYLGPNDYEHREGSGNVFEYLKLLGELAYSLIAERMSDRCCCSNIVDDNEDIIPEHISDACEKDSAEEDKNDIDEDLDDDSEQAPKQLSEEEQFEKIMELFRDEDFDIMGM